MEPKALAVPNGKMKFGAVCLYASAASTRVQVSVEGWRRSTASVARSARGSAYLAIAHTLLRAVLRHPALDPFFRRASSIRRVHIKLRSPVVASRGGERRFFAPSLERLVNRVATLNHSAPCHFKAVLDLHSG